MAKLSTQDLIEIEARHASTGALPDAEPRIAPFNEVLSGGRGRLAEAFAITNPSTHPVLKARVLIARGKSREASQVLREFREISRQPLELSECLSEEARIASMEGRWKDALELSDQALAHEPVPVTLMGLLQTQVRARFELGEFEAASERAEMILSLAQLYPKSVVVPYTKVLKTRILARGRNAKLAEAALADLWKQSSENADQVLTLFRTEIDLKRLAGRDTLAQARACRQLARAMGDDLYEALALADIHFARSGVGAPLPEELLRAAERFPGVARLLAEVRGEVSEQSTTAQTICRVPRDFAPKPTRAEPASVPELIVIPARGIWIELSSLKVRRIKLPIRLRTAMVALSSAPVAKEDFFLSVWRVRKFVPELHDDLIRRTISRLRKTTGIKIVSERGRLDTPGVLWTH